MNVRSKVFYLSLLQVVGAIATSTILSSAPAVAQLVPDKTLGTENSTVNQINPTTQRIDGGAIRSSNLFHSFQEFNVGAGNGVYFSNPVGIENILTRVTGVNPSNIFGKLGVLGDSNLFLINPNGIMFGANASLDIKGSFLATTAPGIKLGDNGFFSAVNPSSSQLLSVNPQVIFANNLVNPQAEIVNRGRLEVGKDLTLQGTNLDLQGQLLAKGNLTLQAVDTVKMTDSTNNPFIAASWGDLLVQGNKGVEISALSHPESGLFAGRDLVLRSDETVVGDAHFWSGGKFQVEKLDGSLGGLYSPNDPIILASGDVGFDSYEGASLHILAGGSVDINYVNIMGADASGNAISPNFDPLLANVTLSDGTPLVIDGTRQPTLDVRAGIDWNKLRGNPGFLRFGNFPSDFFSNQNFGSSPNPTSADIGIGNVVVSAPGGLVFLSNQFESNQSLSGNIFIGAIDGRSKVGNGSAVIIDSRQDLVIPFQNFPSPSYVDTSSEVGRGGDIKLIAGNGIFLQNTVVATDSFAGKGSDINIMTKFLNLENAKIGASNTNALGGFTTIQATDAVSLNNYSFVLRKGSQNGTSGNLLIDAPFVQVYNNSSVFVETQGNKDADKLAINTDNLEIVNGSKLGNLSSGKGNAGEVIVTASESVFLDGQANGIFIQSGLGTEREAGKLTIDTDNLFVQNGSRISNITLGTANAGEIFINADRQVLLFGKDTGIYSQAELKSEGDGGKITINTDNLFIEDGGLISSSSSGKGKGGDILLDVSNLVQLNGNLSRITSQSSRMSQGNSGNITINLDSGSLILKNNSAISTSASGDNQSGNINIKASLIEIDNKSNLFTDTFGNKKAGELTIESDNLLIKNKSLISSSTYGNGDAGLVEIKTNNLFVESGSDLRSSTSGGGNGGKVSIKDAELVVLRGENSNIRVDSDSTGDAGVLDIETNKLFIEDGATVSSSTSSEGDGGNIFLKANELIVLRGKNSSIISQAIEGQGGDSGNINIEVESGRLSLNNGAAISTSAHQDNQPGNITINASLIDLSQNSFISTNTFGRENAGKININTDNIYIQGGSQVSTSTAGQGDGGVLNINTDGLFVNGGSRIDSSTLGKGKGGDIYINASELIALDGNQSGISTLATNARSEGDSGNINIDVKSGRLSLNNGAGISTIAGNNNQSGNISINASLIDLSQSSLIFTNTFGNGNAGNLKIYSDDIYIQSGSQFSTSTSSRGNAGVLDIETDKLFIRGFSAVNTSTFDQGDGGAILIKASGLIELDGYGTQIVSQSNTASEGNAGNIDIQASSISLNNYSIVSSASVSKGKAGSITLNVDRDLQATNSAILTSSDRSSGGAININAANIRLRGNSNIRTNVNSGTDNGGNITLKADSIIAFDDSDVLAFARDGKGGDITFNTPVSVDRKVTLRQAIRSNSCANAICICRPMIIFNYVSITSLFKAFSKGI